MWLGDRSYPLLPYWETIPGDSALLISCILLVPATAALLLLLIGYHRKWVFHTFLTLAFSLVLLDLTKLQVWFYLQIVLLGILSFKDTDREAFVLQCLRWLFPLVYLWAGIHKINPYYLEDTFPWFMEAFSWSASWIPPKAGAWISILAEVGIGLGLYWRKTRRMAVILGIFFHLSILIFLGPLGHQWNNVVWPWNLLMMALLYLWYELPDRSGFQKPSRTFRRFPLTVPLLVLFGLLPGLNLAGWWPDVLSFKMYSGSNAEGILYFQQTDRPCLPAQGQAPVKYLQIDSLAQPQLYLIIDDWALSELKVAPCSMPRRLRQLARLFCSCVHDPNQAGLEILTVDIWRKEEAIHSYNCRELSTR